MRDAPDCDDIANCDVLTLAQLLSELDTSFEKASKSGSGLDTRTTVSQLSLLDRDEDSQDWHTVCQIVQDSGEGGSGEGPRNL